MIKLLAGLRLQFPDSPVNKQKIQPKAQVSKTQIFYQTYHNTNGNVNSGVTGTTVGMSTQQLYNYARNTAQNIIAQQNQNNTTTVAAQQKSGNQLSSVSNYGTDAVTASALIEAWYATANEIKANDGQLFSTMQTSPSLAADGETINIRIASEYQRESIEGNSFVINKLREILHNNNLTIKAVVDPTVIEENKVVYTAKDKLEKMIEGNRYILDLINDFSMKLKG